MKVKRRTEITVETHRILVIRAPRRPEEGWCERCRKHAPRISLSAATEAGVIPEAIIRHLDEGRLHFTSSGEDLPFICLAASTLKKGNYPDENYK